MSKIKNVHTIAIDCVPKGEVYWKHGRWYWLRNNGGIEAWKRGTDLEDVLGDIAHLCGAKREALEGWRKLDLPKPQETRP